MLYNVVKILKKEMDDPRIEWIRDRVYLALEITENEVFTDLLEREDGEAERQIQGFLNETPEDCENAAPIVFYKDVVEEEEEVEVECGEFWLFALMGLLRRGP